MLQITQPIADQNAGASLCSLNQALRPPGSEPSRTGLLVCVGEFGYRTPGQKSPAAREGGEGGGGEPGTRPMLLGVCTHPERPARPRPPRAEPGRGKESARTCAKTGSSGSGCSGVPAGLSGDKRRPVTEAAAERPAPCSCPGLSPLIPFHVLDPHSLPSHRLPSRPQSFQESKRPEPGSSQHTQHYRHSVASPLAVGKHVFPIR